MPVILPAPELPLGPRSALVIATGSYADERLAALRSPDRDAHDFAAVLGDPQVGGFTVAVLRDAGVHALRIGIEEFLANRVPEETVAVYLSCHGVLSPRRRLYFAAADTSRDRLASTGLEARWLIEQLDECKARRQVVVLDCCFSGAFALTKAAKGAQDVGLEQEFGAEQARGRIVLTASRATEYSFEGEPLADGSVEGSVFTAALVDGLRSGAADHDRDGLISVADLYTFAYQRIKAIGAGRQTPQHWVYGGEGEVILARSPAGRTVEPAKLTTEIRALLDSASPRGRLAGVAELGDWLTHADPARVLTAHAELELIATRDNPQVAEAARHLLATIASTTAPTHHQHPASDHRSARATAALNEVDYLIHPLPYGSSKAWALIRIARALVTTDRARATARLDEAEQIVATITHGRTKSELLVAMARLLAASDPPRAIELLDQAQRAAATIKGPRSGGSRIPSLWIAEVMATIDLEHAARLAEAYIARDNAYWGARMLIGIAQALATTDPAHTISFLNQADRLAYGIHDASRKDLLTRIAIVRASATTDRARAAELLDQAEQLALTLSLSRTFSPSRALADIVEVLVTVSLDRAERLAVAITHTPTRAEALTSIGRVVAVTDPGRATAVFDQAEHLAASDGSTYWRERTLAVIAGALAVLDPDRAQRLTATIADLDAKVFALTEMAKAWLNPA